MPTSVVTKLLQEGRFEQTAPAGQGVAYLPSYPGTSAFRTELSGEKPGLLVESVYLYRRNRPSDAQKELRGLYNTLLGISSLAGTAYYSPTKKASTVFYTESYRIDGPDSRIRIPDAAAPSSGALEPSALYYAFQRDSTFGPTIYTCAYRTYPEAVSLESINQTSLSYLGIPVLSPHGLRIRLIVIQTDEGILFYVANSADIPRLPIVKDTVQESISSRADALFAWFAGRQKG